MLLLAILVALTWGRDMRRRSTNKGACCPVLNAHAALPSGDEALAWGVGGGGGKKGGRGSDEAAVTKFVRRLHFPRGGWFYTNKPG